MGSLFGGGGGGGAQVPQPTYAAPPPQIVYVPQYNGPPAPLGLDSRTDSGQQTTATASSAALGTPQTTAAQQQVASNLAGKPDNSTQGFSSAVAASVMPVGSQTTLLGG